MTTKLDSRGVDALRGDELLLGCRIWDEMAAELGKVPAPPVIEPFDEQPWQELWEAHPAPLPLDALLHELAMRTFGDGEDFPKFMAHQRFMAQVELDLTKQREAQNVQQGADDSGAAAGAAGVVSAAALGGGGDVPGERENGDPVEPVGQAEGSPDSGRASKVSRGRGKGKTRQG